MVHYYNYRGEENNLSRGEGEGGILRHDLFGEDTIWRFHVIILLINRQIHLKLMDFDIILSL